MSQIIHLGEPRRTGLIILLIIFAVVLQRLRKAAVDHRGEDQADHESYSESEKQSSEEEEEEEESVDHEPIKLVAASSKASSYSHLVAPASFSAPRKPQGWLSHYMCSAIKYSSQ